MPKCTNCLKPLGTIQAEIAKGNSSDFGFVCEACHEKLTKELELLKNKERHNKMFQGSSFIHIARRLQLSNGMEDMFVKLVDTRYGEEKIIILKNGKHIEIEIDDGGKFYLSARIPGWKVSPPLLIELDRNETVFIEIHSKAAGPLGTLFRMAAKIQMVFPKIIKREVIVDDEIRAITIAK